MIRRPGVLVFAALVLAVAAEFHFQRTPPSDAPLPLPRGTHQPQPSMVPDPLDGEPVSEGMAHRRPIGVIIDNDPRARPQWGLSSASRVYEAITEGGVTRYLAVYGPKNADRIGPVRSLRTQFVGYALELDAPVAHVGGNADALTLIQQFQMDDLNQFRYATAFRRIFRRGLAYEHTVFTSTEALRSIVIRDGRGEVSALDPPRWKDDPPAARQPVSQRVTVDFSDPRFRVVWVYRPAANNYARMLAGAPDIDAATGKAITAKAIAIAAVVRTEGRTRIGEDTWTFMDLGSGKAWVVQDGTVVEGIWRKSSPTDRLRFFNTSGAEIAFDRGPQWVEIVPPEVAPTVE